MPLAEAFTWWKIHHWKCWSITNTALYVHTCIPLTSASLYINQTTCKGGEQISPTSACIIVMPRNAGQPDGSGQQLNRTDQVLNSSFLFFFSCLAENGRLMGDCTGSRARQAPCEVRSRPHQWMGQCQWGEWRQEERERERVCVCVCVSVCVHIM